VVSADRVGALAPFAVSHSLFMWHLDWLQKAGFVAITLEKMFDIREGKTGQRKEGKPVVITFDDCPASLLDHAVPELVKRGMTATFFAVAGKPGGHNDWDAEQGAPTIPLMSGKDLRNLADNGFEIGSHGMSHCNLRNCLPDQIRWELLESRLILEEIVGKPVRYFAYPFGEYPHGHVGFCQEAGYRGAVSIFSRAPSVTKDPYCMRRVLVHEGDQFLRFRFKASILYLNLRRMIDMRVIKMENQRDISCK
jgi:peptidoglycan/xylan/chitin deacetylase (PgdA/CDA1 family)